jgi:hypothetical protein
MSAVISQCGFYRLRLDRDVLVMLGGPVVALIGVNPSTADATENDQTIRKDLGFAGIHGWSRIIKGNKFAYRARDVREVGLADDPIGPDCDAHLREIFAEADIIVPCWGRLAKLPARLRSRWREVDAMMRAAGKPILCFGTAQDGHPLHTMTIPYSSPLVPWGAPT